MAAPIVNEEYKNKIKSARGDIEKAISSSCDPIIMLRLAYACQFSIASAAKAAKTKTTDETPSEPKTEDKENKQVAITNDLQKLIGQIKANHPTITYPDLCQLAGVVAVEKLEGPTIEFVPGRKDPSISPDEGCLPDGNQDLRKVFHPMGLSDKDIVALSGGLNLARAHSEGLGVEGLQTKRPLKFDNSYFVELLKPDSSFLKIPANKALVEDPKFRKHVESYAKDVQAFFRDYAVAHKKFSKYPSSFFESALGRAVGVAVAAAIVISSFFYLIRRRRASKQHSSQQ